MIMTATFNELADLIATEEKAAFANDFARRIDALRDMPNASVRAQIYATCALIGGAELMAEVSGKDFAIRQLRLLSAPTDILTNNTGPVSAVIMHPRDAGNFAGLTDTTNQPLNMPSALSNIPILTTTAIRVDILRERSADNHQYGLVAHMRFDVAVEHAQAFHTITGVQS